MSSYNREEGIARRYREGYQDYSDVKLQRVICYIAEQLGRFPGLKLYYLAYLAACEEQARRVRER